MTRISGAAILLAACLLPGQVIRDTVRLVQVSVIVHDKRGEPVRDLTRDDFTLFDQGKPQKISYFAMESSEALPEELPAGIAPGTVSNRIVTMQVGGKTKLQPLPNSLTVILLDGLNTRFTDQAQTKSSLIAFLKQLQSGDQVAIYTLTNELHVLHDFSRDMSSLLAALAAHTAQESSAAEASSYKDSHLRFPFPELDALIDRGNQAIANESRARRAATTLLALREIGNHLAGLPGRKNLIWLAGDFPVAPSSLGDGIAVYPVDAHGLAGMNEWMPSLEGATRSAIHAGPQAMDQRAEGNIHASQSAMATLADQTGGRACINHNDIAGCIRRAMEDARVTYVLYFTPNDAREDGHFHDLNVKLDRPGVDVRYRKGYYALPAAATDAPTRQSLVADAALGPLPSTGLTMVARLLERPTSPPRAVLSVVMDGHELTFTRDAQGQQEANVDMLMLAFGDGVTVLSQGKRTVHLALTAEAYDLLMKGGVRVTLTVDTPAASRRVRVVARDAGSGRVGSLDVALK